MTQRVENSVRIGRFPARRMRGRRLRQSKSEQDMK
jgi:hypothetical protein